MAYSKVHIQGFYMFSLHNKSTNQVVDGWIWYKQMEDPYLLSRVATWESP